MSKKEAMNKIIKKIIENIDNHLTGKDCIDDYWLTKGFDRLEQLQIKTGANEMVLKSIIQDSEKCLEFSKVESSNIAAVGVLGSDLIIWFKGGVAYVYPEGSAHYRGILASDSKGTYFHQKIKKIPNCGKLCSVAGCLKKVAYQSNRCLDHSF